MWPVLNCYVGDTHHYISLTLDETYFRSLEDWAVSASMILCSHTNDIRLYAYPLQRDTRPSVRSYTNINQIIDIILLSLLNWQQSTQFWLQNVNDINIILWPHTRTFDGFATAVWKLAILAKQQ